MANRTYDGRYNNLEHLGWGQADRPLRRVTTPAYYGGGSRPAGFDRPNPRTISQIVCAQNGSVPSSRVLSDYMWAWGQFLDHELDLTPELEDEPLPIQVPDDDLVFPGATMGFARSQYDPSTGTHAHDPRQQVNVLSAFIDGANVYGADGTRAYVLRKHADGKLKSSAVAGGRDLLPYNLAGLPNGSLPGQDPASLFVAGDVRCNEHVVLTCMHTLFLREHNRVCDKLIEAGANNDEHIYQLARKIVGATMQVVTYKEFLKALLGENGIAPYRGYDSSADATISNVFSTVCYRLGHSMLSPQVVVVGTSGQKQLNFRTLFFNPGLLDPKQKSSYAIDAFLGGLYRQRMQEIDGRAIDDIRNALFPNASRDLAALNIQRGRDHGLPSYNQCRIDFGLAPKKDFSEITSDSDMQARLSKAYTGNIDSIDPWIGGLVEDHYYDSELGFDANVGEFFFWVIKDQFERLRDGDRFWYENDPSLSDAWKNYVRGRRLSTVIRDNTDLDATSVPDDVFRAIT